MYFKAGKKLPTIFKELLPQRFTFEQFCEVTHYRGKEWQAYDIQWVDYAEGKRRDPFEAWRNPDGLYNPDHKLNLVTGWRDEPMK